MWHHDRSWFDITLHPTKAPTDILTNDVISFSFTEEMGKIDKASLTLLDRNSFYANKLKRYDTLRVSWGRNIPRQTNIVPRDIIMYVTNPAGSAGSDGVITFSCNLLAAGGITDYRNISYQGDPAPTKMQIVQRVLTEQLKIPANRQLIQFIQSIDTFTDGQGVQQSSNAFRFLVDRAADWNCYFRLGYDQKGRLWAFFTDTAGLEMIAQTLTAIPSTHLQYGLLNTRDSIREFNAQAPLIPANKGLSNVISYQWSLEPSAGQRGDGVNVRIVQGGEIVLERFEVDTQSTVYWRLDTEKANAEMERQMATGNALDFVYNVVTKWQWEQAKEFFVQVPSTTAPNGQGFRISASLLGDPVLTSGTVVSFGRGFPNNIGAINRRWWIQKCTHKFGVDGYYTDIEVIDSYVLDPTGTFSPATLALGAKDAV